jgi:hypothetical protein
MATTSLKGLLGSVTWAGSAIGNIKNWSMTVDVASNDTTAFGETNTSSVQGLRNATAQVSGDLSTDAQQNTILDQVSNAGTLAGATVVLIASATAGSKAKWTCTNAQLTNVQVGSEVAGVASFSASIQASGGFAYSTA